MENNKPKPSFKSILPALVGTLVVAVILVVLFIIVFQLTRPSQSPLSQPTPHTARAEPVKRPRPEGPDKVQLDDDVRKALAAQLTQRSIERMGTCCKAWACPDWEKSESLIVQYAFTSSDETCKTDFQILSHNVWTFRRSSWDPKGDEPFLLATGGEEVWSVTLSLKQASILSTSPELTLNQLLHGPAFTHVLHQIIHIPQKFNPEIVDEKSIDGSRSYLIQMRPDDSLRFRIRPGIFMGAKDIITTSNVPEWNIHNLEIWVERASLRPRTLTLTGENCRVSITYSGYDTIETNRDMPSRIETKCLQAGETFFTFSGEYGISQPGLWVLSSGKALYSEQNAQFEIRSLVSTSEQKEIPLSKDMLELIPEESR